MSEWWTEFITHPWVAHLRRALDRYDHRLGKQFAAAITYYSVLSMVPVLMFAFSMLGLTLTVLRPEWLEALEQAIESVFLPDDPIAQQLLDIIGQSLDNWAAIGLIGIGTAIFAGTGWVASIKSSARAQLRPSYDTGEAKRLVHFEMLTNLGILIVLLTGVLATFAASSAVTSLAGPLQDLLGVGDSPIWSVLLRIASVTVSLVSGTLLFWFLYWAVAQDPIPYRVLWHGAIIGAVGLAALQYLTTFLLGIFWRSLSAALFGPVIVLMLFLNLFASLILLVAAWMGTVETPVPAPIIEESADERPAVPSKPGREYVSSEVAAKSMSAGLGAGYVLGTATGVGIGALIVGGLRSLLKPRR